MKAPDFAGFYAQGAACVPCWFPVSFTSHNENNPQGQEEFSQRSVANSESSTLGSAE